MRSTAKKGFTLIELLIVVVIIGILAAIAIPKFANTKEKAYVAAMKSDLRNMATAEEGYFADNQTYTTVARRTMDFTASQAVTATVNDRRARAGRRTRRTRRPRSRAKSVSARTRSTGVGDGVIKCK